MKKVYIKPELELIDLSAKELLMTGEDPILDKFYGDGVMGTSVIEDGWF